MTLRIGSVTFGGHARSIRVGRSTFGLPPAARTVATQGGRIVYVLEATGELHALVEGGEVLGMPEPLQNLVRQRLFGATPQPAAETPSRVRPRALQPWRPRSGRALLNNAAGRGPTGWS